MPLHKFNELGLASRLHCENKKGGTVFKDILSEPDLTPANITIYYDERLQAVVGKAKERVFVNKGCPFGYMFQCVMVSYPEIEQHFPPGILGFTLNGVPPDVMDPLKDGDQICFLVCDTPVWSMAK